MEGESMGFAFAFILGLLVLLVIAFLSQTPTAEAAKNEVFAAPRWNRVAEVFKKHLDSRRHRGGGFAVYHKGQLVVECVGGYADYENEWLWDKTTLSCIYGCTKGIGAVVIAMLVDRDLLSYSSPVAHYWPEFAENGKESITVEQLLSHQAGLDVLGEDYTLFDITANPDKISHLLATARPQWKPGTAHGFHSLTIGLYMDQIVKRVDPQHRNLDKFFAEEVAGKFGIDCFIGLPKKENCRCARLEQNPLKVLFDLVGNPKCYAPVLEDNPGSKLVYSKREDNAGSDLAMLEDDYDDIPEFLECDPEFRQIPCVSTNGYSTVAGLAKFYGILANGGCHKGNTLLSYSAVEKLNEPLASGIDSVHSVNSTIGRGTIIVKSEDDHNIFGHPGFCGQVGFADPKHKLGWAYITNTPSGSSYADDWRYRQLIEKVYKTVRELEQREVAH